MPDLEAEEIQELLSTPAESIAGHMARRSFLAGALAVGGSLTLLPSVFDRMAAAATPVAPGEGILVVIQLGGGNDGLNTVIPRTDSRYKAQRGALAIASPLALTSAWGLHPALPKLKARYDAGKVAIVQSVGQTSDDRSHFSSTATWMAGTAGTSRSSGWLGRWLDAVPESAEGLRAVTFGSSIPLHLSGSQAVVTALNTSGNLFGADRSEPTLQSVYDVMADLAATPTGKGTWADQLARATDGAIDLAVDLLPSYSPALPDDSLVSQLTLAARLINADLGIRVLNASLGSFDTHNGQLGAHQALLAELDAAVDAFYRTLQPSRSRQVSLMTFSEFGRRLSANASNGTDHGAASCLMVIGDNVKGGFHGQAPNLGDLDGRGDLKVHVDFRSVYATVLSGWLGADASSVLGGSFEDLGLFKGAPGEEVTGPITTGPWVPFASAATLVQQQYRDFLGREGDASGVAYWAGQLTSGAKTIPRVINGFMDSAEFGRSMAPAGRVALIGLGGPPPFAELTSWTGLVRTGSPLATVAAEVAARPEFASLYGALSTSAYVTAVHRAATGSAPSASLLSTWVADIDDGSATRADLLAHVAALPGAVTRQRSRVEVLMTYAGLLRRKPDDAGWAYWTERTAAGTSIERLISLFFGSPEYKGRFD